MFKVPAPALNVLPAETFAAEGDNDEISPASSFLNFQPESTGKILSARTSARTPVGRLVKPPALWVQAAFAEQHQKGGERWTWTETRC